MAAVSFYVSAGGNLEKVTQGTAAPTAGHIEVRIDQTAGVITDGAAPGGTRIFKKGEAQALLRVLEEAIIRSTSLVD